MSVEKRAVLACDRAGCDSIVVGHKGEYISVLRRRSGWGREKGRRDAYQQRWDIDVTDDVCPACLNADAGLLDSMRE